MDDFAWHCRFLALPSFPKAVKPGSCQLQRREEGSRAQSTLLHGSKLDSYKSPGLEPKQEKDNRKIASGTRTARDKREQDLWASEEQATAMRICRLNSLVMSCGRVCAVPPRAAEQGPSNSSVRRTQICFGASINVRPSHMFCSTTGAS